MKNTCKVKEIQCEEKVVSDLMLEIAKLKLEKQQFLNQINQLLDKNNKLQIDLNELHNKIFNEQYIECNINNY